MSCFTMVDSSPISSAGSSNMPVRRASCASFCSFWLVLWMPMPILAARRANSDCCCCWEAPAGEQGGGWALVGRRAKGQAALNVQASLSIPLRTCCAAAVPPAGGWQALLLLQPRHNLLELSGAVSHAGSGSGGTQHGGDDGAAGAGWPLAAPSALPLSCWRRPSAAAGRSAGGRHARGRATTAAGLPGSLERRQQGAGRLLECRLLLASAAGVCAPSRDDRLFARRLQGLGSSDQR